MQMAEGLDTGDMLLKKAIPIGEEETAVELTNRLAELAAQTLAETLVSLEAGTIHAQPQNDAESSYASRITKEMSALDFTKPAAQLHNQIRAITGFTRLGGKRLKVYASRIVPNVVGMPGTVVDDASLLIACGDGNGLRLIEIQPEGKRRMTTEEFLRGKKVETGTQMGL